MTPKNTIRDVSSVIQEAAWKRAELTTKDYDQLAEDIIMVVRSATLKELKRYAHELWSQ